MFADKLCSLSDEDLIQQYYHTRNRQAFREIFHRYKEPLFRYCAQMDLARCTALMENFWLTLLSEPPLLERQQLKNWLYIRVNRLLNSACGDVTSEINSQETTLQNAFEQSDMLKALQQLPRRQRNIFLLYKQCGLSLATVADIERISLAVCRQELADGSNSLEFNLHGSARKPWVSSVTLAKQAAEADALAQEQAREQPQTAKPRFTWGTRWAAKSLKPSNSETSKPTVEIAQA
uniref:RNA polymerase sigma factor n=1 Tax=Microbulbifer agarilyticus TaxID=260552 RepID=UPI000312F7F7|nr:sigma-70 family RNA polymerase sigma factor [Microbulbifer agarilyticus]